MTIQNRAATVSSRMVANPDFAQRRRWQLALYPILRVGLLGFLTLSISHCSFFTPSLRIKVHNGTALPLGNPDKHNFVTTFESCFTSEKTAPSTEALTRQLFVGWSDVCLVEPIEFQEWRGFSVHGKLDGADLIAVALMKPNGQNGCRNEIVAFGKRDLSEVTHATQNSLLSDVRVFLNNQLSVAGVETP